MFIDCLSVSDERETLRRELDAARARIERLELEAETNRAFFTRALTQAHEEPRRGGGPNIWHVLALITGVGVGVFLTLLMLVLRGEPPPMAPMPPARKASPPPLVASPARNAPLAPTLSPTRAEGGADSGVIAAARPFRPDDRGTLNVTASAPAVVFVDGRRVGPAPVQGESVKPGEHVVRVECATDAGAASEHRVNVPPYADVDVEHRCD